MASDEEFSAGISTTASPSVKQVKTEFATSTDISAATSGLASQEWVNQQILSANPIGAVIVWSMATAPTGYLICDGSTISRTVYANLFSVIGTTYGAGDGSTSFNLPNCTDFTPWQSGAVAVGRLGLGNMPNITGTFGIVGNTNGSTPVGKGAFIAGGISGGAYSGGGGRSTEQTTFSFDASRCSVVYSNADRVVPAWISMKWCIKYA